MNKALRGRGKGSNNFLDLKRELFYILSIVNICFLSLLSPGFPIPKRGSENVPRKTNHGEFCHWNAHNYWITVSVIWPIMWNLKRFVLHKNNCPVPCHVTILLDRLFGWAVASGVTLGFVCTESWSARSYSPPIFPDSLISVLNHNVTFLHFPSNY